LAAMLDRDHPLALPLKRLFVALSTRYPASLHVPRFDPPKPPAPRTWFGDRMPSSGASS
jgi:hypothetical protein